MSTPADQGPSKKPAVTPPKPAAPATPGATGKPAGEAGAAGTPRPPLPASVLRPQAPKPATPGATTPPGVRPPTPAAALRPPTPAPKPPTPAAGGVKPAVSAPKPATPPPAAPAKSVAPSTKTPLPPPKPSLAPRVAVPTKPSTAPAKKPPSMPTRTSSSSADSSRSKRKIGQILVDLGYLDDHQREELVDEIHLSGQRFGHAAVTRGWINTDQLAQALAEQHGLKVINFDEVKPQPDAIKMVPEAMASLYQVLPISVKDNVLVLAMSDPTNLAPLDDLRNLLGIREIRPGVAPPEVIAEAIAKHYSGQEESIIDIIASLENDPKLNGRMGGRETSIDIGSLMEIQDAAPVRKLINMVLLMGIKDRASDIHFEPFEDEYKMRYRCDGVLYEMVPPPRHLAMAIASRIKVMANLDIAERRLPQDGRIELNIGGSQVDMRVSILPTMFGESVCIRVLDRTVVSLDLEKVGMEAEMLKTFRTIIRKPNGVILVTGPTSSGKTTTLYSALSELNEVTDKIITTEDPVEYEIEGICQVPINADIGMTFASALRSILRQDPDRILVGEIRDLETAQIAIQAALTGHMVFSTLHTNDAPSTITRMRDMGVEPYLLTATVEAILAQRLVRKICQACKTQFDPSPEMLMELNLTPDQVKGMKFFYGTGCDKCNNNGYKGRLGLFELIVMNDNFRDLISRNASTDQLRAASREMGVYTLREAGLRGINNGLTTIEEVVRETILEEEG